MIEVKANKTNRSNKLTFDSNNSSYSGTTRSESRGRGTSSYTSYSGNSDGGSVVGGFIMSVVYLFLLFVAIWIVGFTSDTLDTFRDICLAHETTIERIITFIVIAWSLYFPICSLIKKETMLFGRSCIAGFVMLLGYGGLFFAIIHYAYEIYSFLTADILNYSGWFMHALGVLFMPFIGMALFAAPVLLIGSLFTIVFHNAIVVDRDFVVKHTRFVGKASVYGGLCLLTIYMLLDYSLVSPFALFLQFVIFGISMYYVGKYASKMIDAYFIPEHF